MKYLIVLLCFFGLFSGPQVELVDAYKSSWVGGRFESGRGTNYTFMLTANKSSEKIVIDEMWVGKSYFKIKPQRQNKDLVITNDFAKQDTFYVQVNIRIKPNVDGVMESANPKLKKDLPYEYEGGALLGYLYKGKRKYFVIDSVKTKPTVYYP